MCLETESARAWSQYLFGSCADWSCVRIDDFSVRIALSDCPFDDGVLRSDVVIVIPQSFAYRFGAPFDNSPAPSECSRFIRNPVCRCKFLSDSTSSFPACDLFFVGIA